MQKVSRALISVTDKSGLAEFGQGLAALGVEIISTGGTAKLLAEAGVPVVEVSAYTGSPEILDGRVKTLHPKVHGGILARRDDPGHQRQMAAQGIAPIDLVAVNLYAFEEAVAGGVRLAEAIEQIDIGGPCLIRAAAKNFEYVTVVTDPADYPRVLEELKNQGGTSRTLRFELARKAFARTSAYDAAIAAYLDQARLEG